MHPQASDVEVGPGTEPGIRTVHVLLFICPDCNLPVAISRVSNERSLETVDAERFHITCSYCEKSSDVTAVTAKRHYVEDWTQVPKKQTIV
jgi:hypothetical protein